MIMLHKHSAGDMLHMRRRGRCYPPIWHRWKCPECRHTYSHWARAWRKCPGHTEGYGWGNCPYWRTRPGVSLE